MSGAEGHAIGSQARCSRCSNELEAGDLRCAICSLPLPPIETPLERARAEILRCDGCGAALEYDVHVAAPRCHFCGSVAHLERSEDPPERPEAYLPFLLDAAHASRALHARLSNVGFFRPSDLASAASLDRLLPIWWVGWVVDAESLVSWTADSDAGSGRSNWAPHSGQSPVPLERVLVSASRGLSVEEIERLTPGFDLSTARGGPHQMPGAAFERFDVQRSSARKIVSRAIEKVAIERIRPSIPGSRFRKIRVSILLRSMRTRRFAFPSYVLAYRYRDRLYRAVVHGQSGEVVHADLPIAIWKILALIGLAAGLCLLALVLSLLLA
ncbi:MAG: zinc ribbon domain-containing protein [Myxococcales bacterium]|nr:zinc ribbon domain-containing protein [Myxococcales bacterium]